MAYSDPHWLDDSFALAPGDGASQRWHLPIKIASLIGFSFASALLSHVWPILCASLIALVALPLNKVRFQGALRRLAALFGFLLMLLIVLPFTVPERGGDVIIYCSFLPVLSVNSRGLLLAVGIGLRAITVGLILESMIAGVSLTEIVQALAQLKMPGKICQLLLLTYRYIFVLQQEAKRMYAAMGLRGFRIGANLDTFRVMGNFLGMLFVRSFERTQRVYESMVLRGYRGVFPEYHQFTARPVDWVLGAIWFVMGSGLLLLDQL